MTPSADRHLPDDMRRPAELGGDIPVPSSWDRIDTGHQGLAVYADDRPMPPFRSSLSYVREMRDMDLEAWQTDAARALEASLEDYRLISEETYSKDGISHRGVARRVAQHMEEGKTPVAIIQWCWLGGGHGHTLTLSASPVRLPRLHRLIGALDEAQGLRGRYSA